MVAGHKRLLVVSHSGGMAGAETVLFEELRELSKCFDCQLVLPKDSDKFATKIKQAGLAVNVQRIRFKLYGNGVVRVIAKALFNVYAILRLRKTVVESGVELIYSNSAVNWLGMIVAVITKVPHVLHFHEHPNRECGYVSPVLDKTFRYLIMKSGTQCVYISENMRDYWRKRLDLKVNDYVVYNPIKSVDWLACVKKIPGPLSFGFAGTFYPRKNVLFLLEAFAEVRNRHPEVKLFLAGGGPQLGAIKKKLDELQLQESVTLLGQVDNIETLFCEIDIFVLPSISEAMPLVVLEAMKAGKACLVTAECGLHEMFSDGEHCIYIDPLNKSDMVESMSLLVDDEKKRLALAESAKAKVAQLDGGVGMCTTWGDIFKRAMAEEG